MESPDRRAHWQGVYRSRAATEVSWYQPHPRTSLALIRRCRLTPDDPIIDVGGGASVLVDHLLAEGFTRVTVVDVSADAQDIARRRLGARASRVRWIEADVTAWDDGEGYRLWHDRALFHFLTRATDRRRYVASLERALAPGGHLVLAAFAVGGPQQCSGLPIVQYDAPGLLTELGAGFRLVEERREAHCTPAGATQDFAWFRCRRLPPRDSA